MYILKSFWTACTLQLLSIFFPRIVTAQSIYIDGTTPTTPELCRVSCTISGGKQYGQNLFHSFSKFNVDSGQIVLFSDPGVTNILGRVTGDSQSNIFGTLGVSGGNANLFLLNPNGILFGPNSSLSLSGSFVATTANAIQFGNQGFFNASIQEIPSLTVHPSALLFTQKAGPIISQASTFGLKVREDKNLLLAGGNITIENGSLFAPGGRLELGGLDKTGSIDLNFNGDEPSLGFPENVTLADVFLLDGTILNVASDGGGEITINSENLYISGSSNLIAGILENRGSSKSQAGNIVINSTGVVSIKEDSFIINDISDNGVGKAGDIYISANSLLLEEALIQSRTRGKGNAGNIFIQIVDEASFINGVIISTIGADLDGTVVGVGDGGNIYFTAKNILLTNLSRVATFGFGLGKVGNVFVEATGDISLESDSRIGSSISAKDLSFLSKNSDPVVRAAVSDQAILKAINTPSTVTVNARSLFLTDGGQVANFSTGTGLGVGGSIVVDTTNSVIISGFSQGTEFLSQPIFFSGLDSQGVPQFVGLPNGSGFSSGLFTFARESTTGPAGNITVKTGNLLISDGGAVSTQTFNASEAGNITLIVSNFTATNGGQVRSTSSGAGKAGDITLKVTENITLSGSDPNFEERLTTLQNGLNLIELISPEQAKEEIRLLREIGPSSGLFANTTRDSTGSGGNINIDPQLVLIENGAGIAVNSAGAGPGGSISLQSDNLSLSNRGFISAESASGQGGNIDLDIANLLLLRGNSSISASAGDQNTGGDGGNVTINTDLLVALQNSDITANAFTGRGGNIQITSRGVFLSPDSDISASSERGIDGQVEINNPEVDPSESLTELPESVEPPQEVAQGCRPGQTLGNSSFVHVGRGGLPLGPHQTQTPTTVWQDLRAHNLQPTSAATTETSPSSLTPNLPPNIIEAKGWRKDSQGHIYLTASVPQPAQNSQPTVTC